MNPLNTPTQQPGQNPLCHTCGQGALIKRKKFRMSGPVVAIGFILLIPSFLGMLFGGIMLLTTAAATTAQAPSIEQRVRSQLVSKEVPEPIIVKVVASSPVEDSELHELTSDQASAVHQAQISVSGQKIGRGAGIAIMGGFSVFVIVVSFVGGLIGWLLIMRKWVLQCARCGATVSAS